jgi:hypothetical protein
VPRVASRRHALRLVKRKYDLEEAQTAAVETVRRSRDERPKCLVSDLGTQRPDGIEISVGQNPAENEVFVPFQVERRRIDIPKKPGCMTTDDLREPLHPASLASFGRSPGWPPTTGVGVVSTRGRTAYARARSIQTRKQVDQDG